MVLQGQRDADPDHSNLVRCVMRNILMAALVLSISCGASFYFVGAPCVVDADCGQDTECLPLAAQPVCQFKDCPPNGELFDLGYIKIDTNAGTIQQTDFIVCTTQCSRQDECEPWTVCALGVCMPFCDTQGAAYCQAAACDPINHKCGNWP